MTGIIGAMQAEVEALIAMLDEKTAETHGGMEFVQGRFNGTEVVISKCGMGKINAAICAQTMILKYAPKIIINTGVAGAISPLVNIGDIVIGKNAVQHDMDLSPLGLKKGFIVELNTMLIPCARPIVKALENAAKRLGQNYFIGTIATGDQFISCAETKAEIYENFDALACEMEGASIAHVCAVNKTDTVIVRTISDNANGGSPEDFNEFLQVAAEKSVKLICEFLRDVNGA